MPHRLYDALRRAALPLAGSSDLDPLIDRVGDARIVMLGEASHGTAEYYIWRDLISRRLIAEKDFSFIAVEGDWPDCYEVNRFVRGRTGQSAHEVLRTFERWPAWMWGNAQIEDMIAWQRAHNDARSEDERAGFYGLDVYSLWESMRAVLEYLDRIDPAAARHARQAYGCFDPYHDDEQEYAMATAVVPTSCEDEAVAILRELRRNAPHYEEDGREAYFNAEQNALVTRNAELYYRTMVRGGPASWNVRDTHMAETLERLLTFHGPDAKAIVWAHNTHIGDARATDMARAGMTNLGQIGREQHGMRDVALVGFAGYAGSVIAGAEWGAPPERMEVPEAPRGSWEHVLHEALGEDALILLDHLADAPALHEPRGHRAIGVVYRPARERMGNYVPTVLPARYDALIYIEETRALDPIRAAVGHEGEVPETWPTGM